MKVRVNGTTIELEDGAVVSDLIEALGLGERWVVVERNGLPVARASYAATRLRDGDTLEVVRPVQGGSR